MPDKINVFIPHYGKDEGAIPKLKTMLSNTKYEISDSSIVESEPNNAKNTEYIKTLLRPKIEWAGTILVLIGPKTHTRDWVNWEIEYASKFENKRIIGIFMEGQSDSIIPEMLEEVGDSCITWDQDKLNAAISGEIIWNDCDGNPRVSVSDREEC